MRATRRLPFQVLLHRGVGEGATPFPGLLHFALDTYLISLSVKQGGIMYHFKSLWYDSTIGEIAPLHRCKTSQQVNLNMTLNHLMVKLQSVRFREYGIPPISITPRSILHWSGRTCSSAI